MRLEKINNIPFQKKLVALGQVIKNNSPEKVQIFKLEEDVDRDYFKKAWEDKNWEDANYLGEIEAEHVVMPMPCDSTFSMEDKDGNILGLSEITNHRNCITLNYLETAPKYSINNHGKRTFKYIGETMMSFIASLCKREDKDLDIPDVADRMSTKAFYYDNCGLSMPTLTSAFLERDYVDDLIEHNESHTGSKVHLIG